MTKIVLDNDMRREVLQQYHPIILIDLWNLTQAKFENFAHISDNDLVTTNSNVTFLDINIPDDVTTGKLFIYNQDYESADEDADFDDFRLFSATINNNTRHYSICSDDIDADVFDSLDNQDTIVVAISQSNDLDNIIIERSYQIFFNNNEKTEFYFISDVAINDEVNLKIIEQDIRQLLQDNNEYMLNHYLRYVSTQDDEGMKKGNFDNIIFTPENDLETIIPFEYHKGVFYLRLPRFYHKICLHLVSKYYDATDDVALFTSDDILEYLHDNPSAESWISSASPKRNITDKINTTETDGTIARYLIPLPSVFRKFPSVEIDVFYSYTANNISSATKNSQIGLIDTTDRKYSEEQEAEQILQEHTLLSNNSNLLSQNNSTTQIISASRQPNTSFSNDNVFTYSNPTNSTQYFGLEENHIIDAVYESVIKYINDTIYVEEYNQRDSETVDRVEELQTNGNYNYTVRDWARGD